MKVLRIAATALLLSGGIASAQVVRATLTGHVTDPTGASISGAQVTVTDTDTGAVSQLLSNKVGDYTAPYLVPGTYTVQIVAPGFRNYTHAGLVLQTQQTLTENVKMQVGAADQNVTVEGATPLVDIATATTGQVLTAEEVEDLPSNGRSPIGFGHIMYGAVAKGKHSASQVRPFDNGTGSDFSIAGGNSQSNEILLNGQPNMEDGGRIAGYSPQLDSVESISIDEFSANAAMGDTSGGIFNVNTKGGTNQYHGSLSEYYAGSRPLTANPFFQPAGKLQSSVHFNQYGGTLGGPVRIPHVFDGRDKLFFFYALEGYSGKSPATVIESVPTAAERGGDFSALLAISASNQLYNPYSGVLVGKNVSRQAIPNNCLVTICNGLPGAGLTLDPVAQAYMKLIPAPNYSGASTGADGENNFFASDPTTNNYRSHAGTMDWNISSKNKLRFEAHHSNYVSASGQTFGNSLTGSTQDTVLEGGQLDDVHTFTSTLTLETRLGLSRYITSSEPNSAGQSPSTVGMPDYVAANSTLLALPSFSFSDASGIQGLSGSPGSTEAYDTIQLYTSLNKIVGHHNIKVGADIRAYKDSFLSPGAADGTFKFSAGSNGFVTSGPAGATSGANQLFGAAFALFDLGLPNSGSFNVATKFQYSSWYNAFFAQDDWKMTHNFTVSYGLRVDHETPSVESANHQVVGFNPTAANAATAAAIANYTTAPNAALAVSAFQPTGNVIYATGNNRAAYSTAPAYVSPRIGFAYAPDFAHGTLAIRGGFAVYVNPFTDYGGNFGPEYGYSQSTNFVGSNNSNLSPATVLSNPFPTATTPQGGVPNPIVQPYGSTYGINTQLGADITYFAPFKVPYSEHYTLDVQKQIGHSWLFEVGYVGDHQVHNYISNNTNAVPLLPLLSRSPQLDPTVNSFFSASLANPFKGTMSSVGPAASTGLNTGSTISVGTLLQALPEYSSVTYGHDPVSGGNFNSVLAKVQKQMSQGLQFEFNYIYSRSMGASSQLNAGDKLWYGETTSDFPEHASLSMIYQLPFGKGRRFLNNSRLLDELIGGYEVSTIYQYLSGTPLQWGNVDYTGNYKDFANNPHNYLGETFNTANFYTGKNQPNGNNYRTFPLYLLRSDPSNNLDATVLKNFTIFHSLVLQPRLDAFNALNHPQFSGASTSPTSSSFGKVNSQLNSSRQLQVGVHLQF